MLNKLPKDIIIYLLSFLNFNDAYYNLIVSKSMKKCLSYISFRQYIDSDWFINPMVLIKKIYQHKKTLKYLRVRNYENPQYWVPEFPETVEFINCSFDPEKEILLIGNKVKTIIFKNTYYNFNPYEIYIQNNKVIIKSGSKTIIKI